MSLMLLSVYHKGHDKAAQVSKLSELLFPQVGNILCHSHSHTDQHHGGREECAVNIQDAYDQLDETQISM